MGKWEDHGSHNGWEDHGYDDMGIMIIHDGFYFGNLILIYVDHFWVVICCNMMFDIIFLLLVIFWAYAIQIPSGYD